MEVKALHQSTRMTRHTLRHFLPHVYIRESGQMSAKPPGLPQGQQGTSLESKEIFPIPT